MYEIKKNNTRKVKIKRRKQGRVRQKDGKKEEESMEE